MIDGWMIDGWMIDGWMIDGWMIDRWMDGHVDGWALSIVVVFVVQVELPDLGKVTKFRIWHEKRSPFQGWHLSKVRKQSNEPCM